MSRAIKERISVTAFVEERLEAIGKTQRQVAEEAGFDYPNVVSMMKQGKMKVPLNRVRGLAGALEADPVHLLRLVMEEHYPELWESVWEITQGGVLTRNERELIESFRSVTGGNDARAMVVDRDAVVAIVVA